MIKRLFIANRGEIALRIARTARRMGITTILGASEADRTSLPARYVDEVVVIGPAPSSQSYLSVSAVVSAAQFANADAVHPGYGFLSENAAFANALADAGIKLIGPDVSSLEAMGDKLRARHVGLAAGLPVVPGEASDAHAARVRADETGYPLLLKAVSGGGGRGMKRVDDPSRLDEAMDMAMAEAKAAFGDARVYLERYIARGRHVEVQVLGDGVRAIHIGTRDCSIQRRFQKLVEEAPAPQIPVENLDALTDAAVRLARHIGYRGAGTVEFLVDADTFEFYFLEMNARIQVEHPVTEAIAGIDLIEQQILIAEGQPLTITQDEVHLRGHAIEVRINAEDWRADFRPSPGRIDRAAWPVGAGLRIDTHIADGSVVTPYYDSLLGKVIAFGPTRAVAIDRLGRALEALRIDGVETTATLHQLILRDERFRAGAVDTRFFEGLSHG